MSDRERISDERLGKTDIKYLKLAINALDYSGSFDCVTLAKQVYGIAFSKTPAINGTVSELLDKLYSEASTEEAEYIQKMAITDFDMSARMLIAGDLVLFESMDSSGIYVICDDGAVLFSDGCKKHSIEEMILELSFCKRSAALRPSRVLRGLMSNDIEVDESRLTDEQIALLVTAEAYAARGFRCQYDDSRLSRVGGGEFRWEIGIKNPEDYTSQRWGYINCAAFTYELYRVALDLDLGSLYTTYNLMQHYSLNGFNDEPMYPYYYAPSHTETEAERTAVENEFMSKLSVGDLVVIRRNNGNGHVMMYVGGERVVHSGGASYNYKSCEETYEPTVKYMNLRGYLFDRKAKNYIFGETGFITQLGIVRPLDKFSHKIPENTRNRVKNMRNITVEKLCSAKGACTVNPGDELTYTFKIYNFRDKSVTLEISDAIPKNAVYISGDGDFDGGKFSREVTVGAGCSADVSYVVKVSGKEGEIISGTGAYVGGVKHATGDVYIRKTLNAREAEALIFAIKNLREKNDGRVIGFALVNEIYRKAGLCFNFEECERDSIENELFVTEEFYVLRENGRYYSAIAPGLYGGRNLQTDCRYTESYKESSERVRLPRLHDLVVGDIVMTKEADKEGLYLYTGEQRFVNLDSTHLEYVDIKAAKLLEGLIACDNYFVVLRPSMISDK